jgi:N-acetylmuramoyl-L-alanine amidase
VTGRVAVIGDVGGHLDELRRELRRLGAEETTGRLPPDLTVVQVGDLVHRGPDSEGVVALVDSYLRNQPEQWRQLVGNHEAQYLREPAFEWPERVSAESAATLVRWQRSGQLLAAVALHGPGEDFLVTHAGLTVGFWRALGAPTRVEETAAALNALLREDDPALFRPGQMLRGRRRDTGAGPLWAAPATELVPGWVVTRLPYSQLHGHASIFDWQTRQYRVMNAVARRTAVDERAKHEATSLPGGRIIGIDPGHGREPRRPWRAFELQTADQPVGDPD